MSITSNNPLNAADIANLYTNLNNIISSYGGGIEQVSGSPTAGQRIDNADINDLINKVNTLKNDSYLGNDQSLYLNYSIIDEGTKIIPNESINNLSTTILTNLQKIKCRNAAANSNTQKTHGAKSNTTDSNGSCSNGYNWVTLNGFSVCSTAGAVFHTHGTNNHGTKSHGTKTNTYNTHGSTIDILNSLTTKNNT